jgi:hypothetical protein
MVASVPVFSPLYSKRLENVLLHRQRGCVTTKNFLPRKAQKTRKIITMFVNCALALVALVLFVDKKEEFVTGYSITSKFIYFSRVSHDSG